MVAHNDCMMCGRSFTIAIQSHRGGQRVAIPCRDRSPGGVSAIQKWQPGAQHRGLYRVEARVSTTIEPDPIALRPAVLPERTRPPGQGRVSEGDGATVTNRREVLRRIETKGCGVAGQPNVGPGDTQTGRLGAVLDQAKMMCFSLGIQRGDVDRVAMEVRDDDRRGF